MKNEKVAKGRIIGLAGPCFTSKVEKSIFIAEAKGGYGHLGPCTQVLTNSGASTAYCISPPLLLTVLLWPQYIPIFLLSLSHLSQKLNGFFPSRGDWECAELGHAE